MDNIFGYATGYDRVMDDVSRVAGYLWEKGWAERNAGNMSVNITGMVNVDEEKMKNNSVHKLHKEFPNLAGKILLLTGTGTRMRDIALDPDSFTCQIRIMKPGDAFQKISPAEQASEVWPTSELPTHLAIHNKLVTENSERKAILHTHVNELIALTQISEFNTEEMINNLLWSMHPETVFFIPEGAGLVPYSLPGTDKMARLTLESLEKHNAVIWEKHGALAVGENLLEAFDIIDILAKAVQIFFMVKNAGYEPERMKPEDLDEIRKTYL